MVEYAKKEWFGIKGLKHNNKKRETEHPNFNYIINLRRDKGKHINFIQRAQLAYINTLLKNTEEDLSNIKLSKYLLL